MLSMLYGLQCAGRWLGSALDSSPAPKYAAITLGCSTVGCFNGYHLSGDSRDRDELLSQRGDFSLSEGIEAGGLKTPRERATWVASFLGSWEMVFG